MIGEDGGVVLEDSPVLLFPWWSVTKTALSACALQLVAQGQLSLDETLRDRPYSLRQLLQHRAGLPDYGRLASYHAAVEKGEEPWSDKELLERVGGDNLDFAPDEGWAYSNVGYLFVRRIIEQAVDDDIGSAMQKFVFDPLDVQSVRLATKPDDLDGTAWGNAARYHPGWVYHGLLIGTARDAVCFMHGLLSGRLLEAELLEIMALPHPFGGAIPGRPWETTGYGLGLMIGKMAGAGLAIGHSGAGPGSVNAVYHFPERVPACTVAAFTRDDDEGVTENVVARLAARP
jgi:CubicO group peptidase (beta-lactamase class C family)